MANSVDPDKTAPIGAVCSGSTLFASIHKLVNNVRQLIAADNFSRHHFSDAFFLDALRVSLELRKFRILEFLNFHLWFYFSSVGSESYDACYEREVVHQSLMSL